MSAAPPSLLLAAPAKVNLYLRVIGRRHDGFHLLDSLIVFVDLADTLTLSAAVGLRLTIAGPFARDPAGADMPGANNLVLRAARALAAAAVADMPACAVPGAELALTKRIPVAAGLGGGSADAAAALIGLARVWGLAMPASRLHELAAQLGADVPVCLDSRPVLAAGVGEILRPPPSLPECALVLANAGRPVPTADVFRRLQPPYREPMPLELPQSNAAALAEALRRRGNDLTAGAIAICPQIDDVLTTLGSAPGCLLAQMSGSGGTCYGLFGDRTTAERAAAWLHERRPHWFVVGCRLVQGREQAA